MKLDTLIVIKELLERNERIAERLLEDARKAQEKTVKEDGDEEKIAEAMQRVDAASERWSEILNARHDFNATEWKAD